MKIERSLRSELVMRKQKTESLSDYKKLQTTVIM